MIKLERHIEILLLSNDCVIVPDLGGFMAHQVNARYDEQEALFLPPLRTLGFNPQLKLNDSLLAQSYVEAYDISYPEALRRIADEVRELKQHLCNEGSYVLNNIGKLYINDGGNLAFEPCEAGILTPTLYGLDAFEFNTLPLENSSLPQKKSENASTKEDNLNNALKNIVVDDNSVFINNDEDDNDDKTIRIKMSWIRNTVITAAAVILLFIIAIPLPNFNKTGVTMSNISNELLTSMMPKDTSTGELKTNIVKDSSTSRENDTIKKEIAIGGAKEMVAKDKQNQKTSVKENQTLDEDSSYCIILASRITRKNADSFVCELKKAGIADAYTYTHNNIIRVAYGKFASMKDAQDSLRKLRDNHYFEQAWVYEK